MSTERLDRERRQGGRPWGWGRGRRAYGPVLLLAATAAACGRQTGAAADAEPQAVTVGPESVLIADLSEWQSGPLVSGSLQAEAEATVRAEVGGTVLQVMVEQGQAVRRGTPLLRIEEGGVGDNARAAEASVRAAESAAATARRNVERMTTLLGAGAVAQRDLDDARSADAAAQAQLAGARAQLAAARQQLGNTRPAAPIDGVVAVRSANPGDVVAPGAALVTIVDPSEMRLEASVPAGDLGQVRVGAPVTFTVSGYEGRSFEGRVRRISPAADPATRQVPILVTIPNPGGVLVSGLFAEGRVSSERRRALALPDAAVDRRGETPVVTRIRGGRAERVPVRLGARDETGERWEVVGGVEPGDTLVTGAARSLTPGTAVQLGGGAAAPR